MPEKGCHYLIEAYNKLNTDLKLVIAGDSRFTDKYVTSLKKLADERTMFLGNVTGVLLAELLSNAYLLVQPSELEGLSISLLEAMSYGKCAVTSDIPEEIEVLADCGVTFSNKDTNDLREKLDMLIKNPSLVNRLGESARKRVSQNYNWDRITDETESLYHSLL